MGQQSNKIIKRRRRKAYLDRKKELAKSGLARKVGRAKTAAADKPAAKKVAKKAPAKKVAKPAAVEEQVVIATDEAVAES